MLIWPENAYEKNFFILKLHKENLVPSASAFCLGIGQEPWTMSTAA
jgi:hypothetical protein